MSKPPYTITEKAADYLAKIVETVTRLEYGTEFKRNIKLHRENRVRTIHSSLAIEGNSLTLGEVTAVIEGKIVAGKQEEVKEVKNAYEAYDKIMTFDPYKIADFLKAHELMTQGLVKEAGEFRSGDVGVFDGNVAIHVGARPQFVPQFMEELFEWAKVSELHPVLKSAILHYEIEAIHPFADGNGRMGRLWQTLLLAKWNSIFAWIPMESVIYQKRPAYYKTLHIGQTTNENGKFIEFTLSALYEILEKTNVMAGFKKEGVNEMSKYVDVSNVEDTVSIIIDIQSDKIMTIGKQMNQLHDEAYMNGYNWETFIRYYLEKHAPHVLEDMEEDSEAGMYAAYYPLTAENQAKAKKFADLIDEMFENQEEIYRIVREEGNEILWD